MGDASASHARLAAALKRDGDAWLAAAAAVHRRANAGNVHRLRLATRRLRGVLDLAAVVLDEPVVDVLRRRLRRPFRRAGRLRDLQVARALLRARWPRDPAALALARSLDGQLARRSRRLRRALRARRRRRLATALDALGHALASAGATAAGRRRIATAIPRRLTALAAAARPAPTASPATDELHRARLRIKRYRYALLAADGIAAVAGGSDLPLLGPLQSRLGEAVDLAHVKELVDGSAALAATDRRRLGRNVARDHASACRVARATLAGWTARHAAIALDTPGPDR